MPATNAPENNPHGQSANEQRQPKAPKAPKAQSAKKSGRKTPTQSVSSKPTLDLLKKQHREIEALLSKRSTEGDLGNVLAAFTKVWVPHILVEEELLDPASREAGVEGRPLDEAQARRDIAKILLADLLDDPSDAAAAAKLEVLAKEIDQLIQDEERPKTGLIAAAISAGVDLERLRPRIEAMANDSSVLGGNASSRLAPRSLHLVLQSSRYNPEESQSMARQSTMRERDDQGRFMSDDDDDRRGSRSSSREYDDRTSGRDYNDRSSDRERDDRGRFMSDDDDGRYSSRGRSNDDDQRGSRGRGQGGWFGDSEGHSEASRRGWEDRGGSSSRSSRNGDDDRRRYEDDDRRGGSSSRSSSRYDDDERRSGSGSRSSRYDDDDNRRSSGGRSQGGWFGDSEGHSEASRRGWQNSDHGESGWYGDSEGHSEASRRGWEGRSGSGRSRNGDTESDDRRSRSRNDDDDDRRSSRGGRGQGGWFGDPEGHSEAARRGRESRR